MRMVLLKSPRRMVVRPRATIAVGVLRSPPERGWVHGS